MKNKNILSIVIILLLLAPTILFAQGYSIKLVFEPGFYNSFQAGQNWQDVDPTEVQITIVNIVANAYYNGYGIPVFVAPYPYNGVDGDVIAYIGRDTSSTTVYGYASTGIGSYCNGTASCAIYSNNVSMNSTFIGTNKATVTRIGRALGSITVHEIGHLFNLYHAYMFDNYDPNPTGGTMNSLNYHPVEPIVLEVGKLLHKEPWITLLNKTSPPQEHFMVIGGFASLEETATTVRHFSDYSKQVIPFARDRGGSIAKSMVWGVPGGQFHLNKDIFVDDVLTTFYAGAGCSEPLTSSSVLYLNNHKIRVTENGKIVIVGSGSVSPNFVNIKRGLVLTGIYTNLRDAINDAINGETIVINGGTHTVSSAVTIPAGRTLQIEAGATVYFGQGLTIYGTLKTNGTAQNRVILNFANNKRLSSPMDSGILSANFVTNDILSLVYSINDLLAIPHHAR